MAAEALSALSAKLRALPAVGVEIASAAAPGVLAAAKAHASAGTTPDGAPWAPRKAKSGGGRALVNAAAAITVETARDVIFLWIRDKVHVAHQFKVGPGYEARKILPDVKAGDAVPKSYVEAIRSAAVRVIGRVA